MKKNNLMWLLLAGAAGYFLLRGKDAGGTQEVAPPTFTIQGIQGPPPLLPDATPIGEAWIDESMPAPTAQGGGFPIAYGKIQELQGQISEISRAAQTGTIIVTAKDRGAASPGTQYEIMPTTVREFAAGTPTVAGGPQTSTYVRGYTYSPLGEAGYAVKQLTGPIPIMGPYKGQTTRYYRKGSLPTAIKEVLRNKGYIDRWGNWRLPTPQEALGI